MHFSYQKLIDVLLSHLDPKDNVLSTPKQQDSCPSLATRDWCQHLLQEKFQSLLLTPTAIFPYPLNHVWVTRVLTIA